MKPSRSGRLARLLAPFEARQLASSSGLSIATIYRIRSGVGLPRVSHLKRLADATGLPLRAIQSAFGADVALRNEALE